MDGHVFFEVLGDLSTGFVGSPDDVHRCLQAGSRSSAAHQADDGVQRVEQQALAGAADVGEEAAFDRIVLRAVAGIVRHADLDTQFFDQMLQVLLEEVLRRRIAAAAIAQPEDRRGVGVTRAADAVPVPAETVAGELAGVLAQADVDVPAVANQVVNAVGNDQRYNRILWTGDG